MEILDCVGVPEFYVSHFGTVEDAGNGMVRLVRCIERGGVLIPVFSCVTPAVVMLDMGPMLREFAQKIVCREGFGGKVH